MNLTFFFKTKQWIDKLQPRLNMTKPKRIKTEWTAEDWAQIHARANELSITKTKFHIIAG